ncbi:AP-3 complex subunit beta-1 isoform 2-T2 [Molossus nigricans]|nr:AP-3 complex subunit beta-1 isoform X3 [Molossus molossus]XP_036134859.1 AP-3 complex subunit beta-1 isoform X3 [Molossus molossus]XP_036134860.1 AP-3 complex subunit beta-1 isoform X3 [Molossus molossus]XP_036134861.1 AP-3 complex subunit beta-1 isoform X3 [Molossus molossus]XP_036134863.1 AP-3 complex subunit beta-1 isoform X3 [Molossus molossus]XP_036134864.1 AP-3 complex subunit beta-1 isoform X3 [Molossus molossus]KAF6488712.1 adaptor related protein complex 3 subunit beta 1 [Molossus
MIAKGRNASELFPAVVKNVASKNIEIKKLVYVYLVRYAEEQQDLALLSISTFQRALKDPNQLIRASALRVLSSIRVPIIVPIMMLAIKEASSDLSPYVRKNAAHAIQKLYSLDPEQKEMLIEVIEKLLKDKSTLVAGSVVMAFEEVCPDRIDLIHKNYRKLCNLLVDVEEWGQVVIIHMLTRYARTQFVSPWKEDDGLEDNKKDFYESDDEQKEKTDKRKKPYTMDPDHRLLIRNTKPLLQSRNAAVVMAVAQLYWHISPKSEVGIISKSLVRLLRSNREVQYIVLQNIATMSIQRKGMFEPYLKSFYVRSTDPTMIKTLKLEILTNLANEANISTLLREFQTYVKSQDKQFAAATIQTIGRCATNILDVTDTCLNGLVCLLSNKDEIVVAESVVVIKKLLQMQPAHHGEIIKHMAKLLDSITVPVARASILWLIGENCERVPKIAPDVLRKMAKSFTSEDDLVKLQILNLGAKLYLTNSKQTKLLTQYILNLGKYDQNYDIRDRTRFIRQLIVPNEKSGALSKYAKKIFLAQKPAPLLESPFKDRDHFQLGTLSHTLNTKATGYLELSNWPEVAPDPSVRNVEVIELAKEWTPSGKAKTEKPAKKFYSESEEEEDSSDGSSDSESESGSESGEQDEEGDSSDDSSEDSSSGSGSGSGSESEVENRTAKRNSRTRGKGDSEDGEKENEKSETSDSSSAESSSIENSSSESESISESESKSRKVTKEKEKKAKQDRTPVTKDVSLLDLDDFNTVSTLVARPTPALSPSLIADLEGLNLSTSSSVISVSTPVFVPMKTHVLLHRMSGKGLAAHYFFSRQPCIFGNKMVSVQITLNNTTDRKIENIHIGEKKLPTGMEMHDFNPIESLEPEGSITVSMGIDFCDSTQTASFQLCTKDDCFNVNIQPPVGELLLPVAMSEKDFKKEQGMLTGMNETSTTIILAPQSFTSSVILQKIVNVANVGVVPSGQDNVHRFAAKTVHSGSLMLVTVELKEGSTAQLIINTEKTVIGSVLLRELKPVLSQG